MTSTPHVLIRPAAAADFDAVACLTRDAYLAAGYFDSAEHPYMQHLQEVARRAEVADVWVAEADGAVAGSVTVVTAGNPYADIAREDEVEFRMLAVDPAVQRGGIGRALVDAVVDHARRTEGISGVSLTTGTNMVRAHRLYESLGFDRVPERDWLVPDTDIRLLVFRLTL